MDVPRVEVDLYWHGGHCVALQELNACQVVRHGLSQNASLAVQVVEHWPLLKYNFIQSIGKSHTKYQNRTSALFLRID